MRYSNRRRATAVKADNDKTHKIVTDELHQHDVQNDKATLQKLEAEVVEKSQALDVATGERIRISHALDLMEAMIQSMRIALLDAAPIGMECPQALLTMAGNIVAHAAAADVALRLKDG